MTVLKRYYLAMAIYAIAFFCPTPTKAGPPFNPTFTNASLTEGTDPSHIVIVNPPSQGSGETIRNAIALINLLIVVFVFYITQRNRRKEDADKQRKATSAYWYQKIIIEPNIPKVIDFFDCCKKGVLEYEKARQESFPTPSQQGELLTAAIATISNKKRELVGSLVHPLQIVDNKTAVDFGIMLDDAQDAVSESLDAGIAIDNLTTIIDTYKIQLLSKLYRSHISTCDLTPTPPSFLKRWGLNKKQRSNGELQP